jgi:hypothetical protein
VTVVVKVADDRHCNVPVAKAGADFINGSSCFVSVDGDSNQLGTS